MISSLHPRVVGSRQRSIPLCLPPVISVSASRCRIGADDGYADEGPSYWIEIAAFAIGVYPVTNREYSAFLAANPTYPLPRYWRDPRFNHPRQPVVGVTWYDAVAYSSWLTEQLARQGQLPDGHVARLPLETEWEKAASWDPQLHYKRRYPWGNTWDPSRANTASGATKGIPSTVDRYPNGASAYGVYDMLGNVWEWTASTYANYPGAATTFHHFEHYTIRGGSCAMLPTHLRCTYRCYLPNHSWRYHLGFRVVIAPPLDIVET